MVYTGVLLLSLFICFGASESLLDAMANFGPSLEVLNRVDANNRRYDFVIVGAGSAGSVLANRLSENKKWNVLLLEAGGPETILHQIPILVGYFQLSKFNWGYKVEPQKNACLGMVNRQCSWPRGKALGGTSTLNYMIHTRGNKLDYDTWATLGNEGWSYDDVLYYYKKSERFDVPGINNSSYHGNKGYLCVEHVPYHTELAKAFLKAGRELGYKIVDYNGAEQIGFSYIQANLDKGTRCSASKAYLRVNRPNLNIVTGATVTKVLIDENKRAYGVEYVQNNQKKKVFTTKELILSAGTIDSAKLLMLSGIGPKDHLEQLGIEVLQDSKVGYNMYEHIGFLGLTFLVNQPVSLLQSRLARPSVFVQYFLNRDGLMSLPGGAEALAFIRTKYAPDPRPDVELLFASGSLHSDRGLPLKKALRISDELYNTVYRPIENHDAWSIWPILQNPRSIGRLTLKSKDPFEPARLEPNFFTHPADVEIILEGIKHAINVSRTAPFQKYGTRLHDIKIPGCEAFEFASDDYWRCAIKHLPSMMNHEIGTVKMGPKNDPDAVVDPQLRVYGVKGLRVVDASIMPTMPTGHVNAGIYMIGEKAADMIKQSWKKFEYDHNICLCGIDVIWTRMHCKRLLSKIKGVNVRDQEIPSLNQAKIKHYFVNTSHTFYILSLDIFSFINNFSLAFHNQSPSAALITNYLRARHVTQQSGDPYRCSFRRKGTFCGDESCFFDKVSRVKFKENYQQTNNCAIDTCSRESLINGYVFSINTDKINLTKKKSKNQLLEIQKFTIRKRITVSSICYSYY
ncbi:glucose dehydrogenase [FAD, quinone]-like [Calliopsis andreniformis]|uniref:glucose dehydrogenase [FAD, quinone]-like n=1 Tax=Calliopsis andreniformis TaxID=337506 RepID=UPI003FCDE1EF